MKEKLIEWLIRTFDVTVIDLESKILIDFYQINKVVVIDWEEVEKIEGFFAKKISRSYIDSSNSAKFIVFNLIPCVFTNK